MSKTARELTDQELERIEKELIRIYSRAEKELGEKAEKYFNRFEAKDEAKKKLLDAGEITEKEYKDWRIGQMMTGKHWTDMRDQMAERLTNADKEAMAYLNGKLPDVYSINYNEVASDISNHLKGYSFELVDANTVKNLATSDETLLPYKVVDGQKAERWHTKTVNSEVMQGILQGESIPHLAKRLEQNVGMKAAGSAVRNARTTVTSAENKGRMDMLHSAQEKGVLCHKIWLSSNEPGRTRDAHMPYDFKSLEVEVDEPFENSIGEIMYPGDPSADPANVYNCRCSLKYKVVGFGENMIESDQDEEENPVEIVHTTNMDMYDELKHTANANRINHLEVDELKEQLSNEEIVEKLGGGDMTSGSCASLGFAYVGNTCGIDVTDYRGGNSQGMFSRTSNIKKMFQVANANVQEYKYDRELKGVTELLKNLPVSAKEYYLSTGRHAAIIRKDEEHGLQYLELQSSRNNGWKNFIEGTLQNRFGCRKTADYIKIGGQKTIFQKTTYLVDVSSFSPTEEFKDMLGYINTESGKQKKGVAGNVK